MDSVIVAIGHHSCLACFCTILENNGSKIQGNRRRQFSIMAISAISIGTQTSACHVLFLDANVCIYNKCLWIFLLLLLTGGLERGFKEGLGLSGTRCAWHTSGAAAGQHPLTVPLSPGQLQCGSKYGRWTGARPTGWTICPSSPRWTSCASRSRSSSRWSPTDRGCSTVANRYGELTQLVKWFIDGGRAGRVPCETCSWQIMAVGCGLDASDGWVAAVGCWKDSCWQRCNSTIQA